MRSHTPGSENMFGGVALPEGLPCPAGCHNEPFFTEWKVATHQEAVASMLFQLFVLLDLLVAGCICFNHICWHGQKRRCPNLIFRRRSHSRAPSNNSGQRGKKEETEENWDPLVTILSAEYKMT